MRRKIDELGRIVIPAEYRKELDINKNDEIEMGISRNNIFLNKYTPSCIFCDTAAGLVMYKKYNVCENCREVLAEAKEGSVYY